MNDDSLNPVVLLVDDDQSIRDAARTFLERQHKVDSAWNLDTALNVFHHHPNNLMVGFVDIHMQGSTDGLDIIQYGKEYMPHRAVLYGWTGNWTLETERKVFAAGGHGLLAKNEYVFERMEMRAQYPNALELVKRGSEDPLTTLLNRRAFEEEVLLDMNDMKERKRAQVLHLIAVDLDKFKAINDTYGHLVGDRCLKRVADVIKSHVRRRDHPCRYGGDEFLVCMVGVSREVAIKTARAIQTAVAKSPVEGREGILIPLSLSWGLAELHREHISYPLTARFAELKKTADDSLYDSKRAKEEGRQEAR